MADANIRAVITAEDRASSVVGNFGSKLQKFGATAARVAKRGLFALGAAGAYATKQFVDQEKAEAQLNAVLKSTGHAAGVTAKQALRLSESLQKTTTFADEAVLEAENLLLTFTKISKDIFPDATKIVLDMSEALGQDLKSSSIQVGKALQDPILGITALRRVGVNFNAEQKEVVKRLVETGQSAKAQALILKELQTEFGGSAVAARNTFGGSMKALKNNIGEVSESLGKMIAERLGPLVARFNEWVQTHQPEIKRAFREVIDTIGDLIRRIGALIGWLVRHKEEVYFVVAAYVALKAAMFISSAVKALQAGLAAANISLAFSARRVMFLSKTIRLLPTSIAIGIALIGWEIVMHQIRKTGEAMDNLTDSRIAADASLDKYIANLRKKGVSDKEISRRVGVIQGGPGRQLGGEVKAGMPYRVGEGGKSELFVPKQPGQIIPERKLPSPTINLNVNIGLFAGTKMERRQIAKVLFKDFQDVAKQFGLSPTALLDSTNGARIR